MKRRILAAALAAGIALGITGCSAPDGTPAVDEVAGDTADFLYELTIELTDGRTVTCVTLIAGYKGGLSCDWEGSR